MVTYDFEGRTFTSKVLGIINTNFEYYYKEKCKSIGVKRLLLSVFNMILCDTLNDESYIYDYVERMKSLYEIELIEDSQFSRDMAYVLLNITDNGEQAYSDCVISRTIAIYSDFVICLCKILNIQRVSSIKTVKSVLNVTNMLVLLETLNFPHFMGLYNGYNAICNFKRTTKKNAAEKAIESAEESDSKDTKVINKSKKKKEEKEEESDKEESDKEESDEEDEDEEDEESDEEDDDD